MKIRSQLLTTFLCGFFLLTTWSSVFAQSASISFPSLDPIVICSGEDLPFYGLYNDDGCFYGDISFSWEYNSGDGWEIIDNSDPVFTNNGLDTITAEGFSTDYDGFQIRFTVQLSNPGNPTCTVQDTTVVSDSLTLMVFQTENSLTLDSITVSPNNGTACAGQNYTLTANHSDSAGETIWYDTDPTSGNPDNVGTGDTYTTNVAGTYYARLEDTCNSSITLSVSLTFLVAPTSFVDVNASPANACPGDNVTLLANGGINGDNTTTVWYDGLPNSGGNQIGTGNTLLVNPNVTTNYYVRREGCLNTDPQMVTATIYQQPNSLDTISVSNDNPCVGDTIILTASGGGTTLGAAIVWYDGPAGTGNELGTGDVLNVEATLNSTYYVRRENPCVNGFSGDISKTVVGLPRPQAAFAQFSDAICIGEETTFLATENEGMVNYDWDFTGADINTFQGLGPISVLYPTTGDYTIALTVSNASCVDQASLPVVVLDNPDILVDGTSVVEEMLMLTVPEGVNNSFALSSNLPDASFSWRFEVLEGEISGSPGEGSTSAISMKWELPNDLSEALLQCTVTAQKDGCESTATFKVRIKRLLFIPDVLSPNGDGFNECWQIDLTSNEFDEREFTIELYNRNGKCVRGCSDEFTIAEAIEWCGNGCAAGPYWYVIKGPDSFEETGALTLIK